MEREDIQLLVDWLEANKDHRLTLLEKEAVKAHCHKQCFGFKFLHLIRQTIRDP